MNKQKRVHLIISIILGITGLILLSFHLRKERERIAIELTGAFKDEYKTLEPVMVAKDNIPAGVVITSKMLESKIMPRQYIQPQAATSLSNIVGMRTVVPIEKGEQIVFSKLTTQVERKDMTLAMKIPVGKRAITISIDKIGGLVGMIKEGDYVDVVTLLPLPAMTAEGKQTTQTATVPLFQNVLVLGVGRQEEGKTPSLVTLALSPQEASILSFVSEQAKVRLILRSPADGKVEELPVANWETVLRYLNFSFPSGLIEGKKTDEPKKQIEIYRGNKKDYLPLSE